MEYELDEDDRSLAKRLASKRDSSKEATCHNGSVSRTESRDRHVIGLCGEIAFARVFGYEVDRSRRPDGDDGFDFVAPCGATIDVKTRSEPNKDFALTGASLTDFSAHCGVLAWPRPGRGSIELVGWTTPTHLLWTGQVDSWGPVGKRRWIEYDELLPIDILYNQIAASNA